MQPIKLHFTLQIPAQSHLNVQCGYGITYHSNGDKYEGELDVKYDEKNEFGIFLDHKDNTIYTGHWMNDQKEGPGHFRHHLIRSGGENDKLYAAEWRCGYFMNLNFSVMLRRNS